MFPRFACWGLALTLAFPASADISAAVPATSTTVTKPFAEALELARLMAPRQLMIDGELRQFDLNFPRTLLQNKEVAAVEARYPGLIEAMAKACRPLLGQQVGERLDRLYPQLAATIQADLSQSEIAELKAFFGSPEGQSILKKTADSVDAGPVYDSAAKDGQVSEEAMKAQQWIATLSAVGKYSEADRAALMSLKERPVFAKLAAVQQELRKMVVDAMRAPDPAYEKQTNDAMSAAVANHIETLNAQSTKAPK